MSKSTSQQTLYDLESIIDLNRRQNKLLDEINHSQSTNQASAAARKKRNLLLKRKYNVIVDKITHIQTGPFTDSLETLPPELWIQIITHVIKQFDIFSPESHSTNQLLLLANISKTWSDALVSVPSFWTTVILDATDEDYLAKAFTSFELSGLCELDVTVRLSLRLWKETAPRIVLHGRRFRSLRLIPLEEANSLRQQELHDLIDILGSFDQLPILRHLHVMTSCVSHTSFNRSSPNRALESLILKRMPSLRTIADLPLTLEMVTNLRKSEIKKLAITDFGDDMVNILVLFVDLQYLDILLRPSPPRPTLSHLRVPVSSVRIEIPELHALEPYFGRLGLGLRRITINQIGVEKIFDTLSSLQQFKNLDHISLYLTQSLRQYDVPPNVSRPYRLPTLTSLELGFGTRGDYGADMWLVRWSNAIFDTLINATPSLEILKLAGDIPSNAFLPYVKTLGMLKQLSAHCNLNKFPAFPYPRAGQRLEHLNWSGNIPTQIFDHFECPQLLALSLNGKSGQNPIIGRSKYSSTSFRVPMLNFNIPLTIGTYVTSLTLTMGHPIYWNLTSFPVVNHLRLADSIWISDFFEQLLLRPNECPKLEHITIDGRFYEWDILLLMLERRNCVARQGTTPIRSIKFNRELSLNLLYSISSLLRGMFLTDIRMADFSLRAIAKRIFDPTQTGCLNCCRTLRECKSLIIPRAPHNVFEYEGLGWHYALPHTFLSPDPELSPDVAGWIAGKRARRVAYMLRYEQSKFSRIPDCPKGTRTSSRIVTAYSEDFDYCDGGEYPPNTEGSLLGQS